MIRDLVRSLFPKPGAFQYSALVPAALAMLTPARAWAAGPVAGNAAARSAIIADGRTNTVVTSVGNVTNITSGTVRGGVGYNSFQSFFLAYGDKANLYVPSNAGMLVNIVRAGPVNIRGILTSYQNGAIGGDIVFADSYGLIVGRTGVVDVGSFTAITPTPAVLNDLVDASGRVNGALAAKLLVGDVPLSSDGSVVVRGAVLAKNGVRIFSGNVQVGEAGSESADVAQHDALFQATVNTAGLIEGGAIVSTGGAIEIVAANAVTVSGTLRAPASHAHPGGVSIAAGGNVGISGRISANGTAGVNAGNISITAGHDIQIAGTAVLSAAGKGEQSNGGTIAVQAGNDLTAADGASLAAEGGSSGNAGTVELNAKNAASIGNLSIDLGATNGSAGALLIDPGTITVDSTNDGMYKNTNGIAVTLTASQSITIANGGVIDTVASSGNSGDISLTAPSIDIQGGATLQAGAGSTAGNITLTATATQAAPTAQIAIGDNSGLGATVKGGNITLLASSTLSSSYDHATITVENAQVQAAGGLIATATAIGGTTVTGVAASASADVLAQVRLLGSANVSSAGDMTLTASAQTTAGATGQVPSVVSLPADAAVAVSNVTSIATVEVGGSSTVDTGNTSSVLSLSATNTVASSAIADASGAAGGAAVAVNIGDVETMAKIDGAAKVTAAGALKLGGTTTVTQTTDAKASQGGAAATPGTGSAAAQWLTDPRFAPYLTQGGSSVTGAAALALGKLTSTTTVTMSSTNQATAGGALSLQGTATNGSSVNADGSSVTPGNGTVGIGAAVALDLARVANDATVAQDVHAGSMTISALASGGASQNTFDTSATSGIGASDVGVAGAFAANLVDSESVATVASGTVTLTGGSLGLSSDDLSSSTVAALPAGSGTSSGASGGSVGVGASVGLNIVATRSQATLADGVTVSGAGPVSLSALGTHVVTTQADQGAAGGVAVTPVVAVSVVNDQTQASIGALVGGLSASGDVTVSAQQTATEATEASGSAAGGKAAVGAAIAVSVVNDTVVATTSTSVDSTGAVGFAASGASESVASATASASGGNGTSSSGSSSGSSSSGSGSGVDGMVQDQTNSAESKGSSAGVGSASQQSADSSTSSSENGQGSTSEGSVAVAAAIGVDVANSTVQAYVPAAVGVKASNGLSVTTVSNMDARTVADGSQVGASSSSGTQQSGSGSGGSKVGIGAAVAITVANQINDATLGGGTSLAATPTTMTGVAADQYEAGSLTVSALQTDLGIASPGVPGSTAAGPASVDVAQGGVSGREDLFGASATSGAGASDVGLAGSLAVNVINSDSSAVVAGGANVTINGGAVAVGAENLLSADAAALPSTGGASGGKLGVGASVALNTITEHGTAAIQDGATLSGTLASLSVTANSVSDTASSAQAGASGGVAVDAVVGMSILNENTLASVGSGSAFDSAGNVEIAANSGGANTASAIASIDGSQSNVAVGGSVALITGTGILGGVGSGNAVTSSTTAILNRNATIGGSLAIAATSARTYQAESTASASGNQFSTAMQNGNDATSGGGSVTSGETLNTSQAQSAITSGTSGAGQGESQASGGSSSSSGKVSVAAAVGAVIAGDQVSASIGSTPTGTAGGTTAVPPISVTGATSVSVTATNQGDVFTEGNGSTDTSSKVGIGVGVALGIVGNSTTASIADKTVLQTPGSVSVNATSSENQDQNFMQGRVAAVAMSGASASKVAVAGSVAAAVSASSTTASLGNDVVIEGTTTGSVAGALSVEAVNTSALSANAWSGSASDQGVGIGASIAAVVSTDTYSATVGTGGVIDAAGVTVSATNENLNGAPSGLITLANDAANAAQSDASGFGSNLSTDANTLQTQLKALSSDLTLTLLGQNNYLAEVGAGAASGNSVAIAGGFAVEFIQNHVKAEIGAGTTVDSPGGEVSVQASDQTSAKTLVGSLAVSGGSAGVGVDAAVLDDSSGITATIDGGATVQQSASVNVAATSTQDVALFAVSAGAADSVGVGGVIGLVTAGRTASATIGAGSTVNAAAMNVPLAGGGSALSSGAVDVSATNDFSAIDIGGGIGVGSSVGIGATLIPVVINDNAYAQIDSGATAKTSIDAASLTLSGTSAEDVTNIAVAGSAAGDVAISGVATPVTQFVTTDATIGQDATITATTGAVDATAQDTTQILNVGGAVGGGGTVGVGGAGAVSSLNDTTEAYIGDGSSVTAGGAVTVKALATESVLTDVVTGAVGGSAGVAVALASSAISDTTEAYLGYGTSVTADSVDVQSRDNSTINDLAGSLAGGGSFGAGAGADVNVLIKNTYAWIGQDAAGSASGAAAKVTASGGDVTVKATSHENVTSLVAGAAIGGTAGAAGALQTYVLTGNTQAAIATGDTVTAWGTVAVLANDTDALGATVGGGALGGTAGVGAAIGVVVADQTTLAGIATNANVTALGNGSGATVTVGYAGQFSGGSESNPTTAQGAQTEGSNLSGGTRTTTAVTRTVQGVVVNAAATSALDTLAVGAGLGGTAGVAASGSVPVVISDTEASVGAGAQINQNQNTGLGPNSGAQSVAVAAASDLYVHGITGALGGGGVAGIGAGLLTNIIDNTTKAFIDSGTTVSAQSNVDVTAAAREDFSGVTASAGLGGVAGIAGGATALAVNDITYAYIDGAVTADGSVAVTADDQTSAGIFAGSAGLGVGGAGVGAGIGVAVISKDTESWVGPAAMISALGKGSDGAFNVFTAGTSTATTPGQGVLVSADSGESLDTVAVAGAGGLYAGVAGAVAVDAVSTKTLASIDGGAAINGSNAGANPNQSVDVVARDSTALAMANGAVGVGAAGVGGAVAVAVLTGDTAASIGDLATVNAAGDVSVAAYSNKGISSDVVGVGGGVVGLGASINVLAIANGATAESSQGSDSQTIGEITTTSGHQSVGGNADSTIQNPTLSGALSGSSNANVQSAGSTVQTAENGASASSVLGGNGVSGTSATIGNAAVSAGGRIAVDSQDVVAATATTNAAGVGGVGIGAGVGVGIDTASNTASIAGKSTLSAGSIAVDANTVHTISENSLAGGVGLLAGADAVVAYTSDQSATSAYVSGSTLDTTAGVDIQADSNRTLTVSGAGGSVAGAVAAGASVAIGQIGAGASAYESGATIDASGASSQVTIESSTTDSTQANSIAVSAGLGYALDGSVATATDNATAASSVEGGTITDSGGTVTVKGQANDAANATASGGSVAISGAAGASIATATVAAPASSGGGTTPPPNVTADVRGARITAGALDLWAKFVQPVNGNDQAPLVSATATGISGALLIGANASAATATNDAGAVASAENSILTITGAVDVEGVLMTDQTASASGVSLGGLLALGANVANASSDTTTKATFLDMGTVTAGSLTLNASGADANSAGVIAGSGGAFSGSAASGTTSSIADTVAFLGNDTSNPITVTVAPGGTAALTATHTATFSVPVQPLAGLLPQGGVDSTNAALVGASGATLNNNVYSTVDAGLGPDVHLSATNFTLDARNLTANPFVGESTPYSAAFNPDNAGWDVNSGSGGLVNLPAASSTTAITLATNATVGDGASVHLIAPTDPTQLSTLYIEAYNDPVVQQKVNMNSGGAIATAAASDNISVQDTATVTIGNDATLLVDIGNIQVGAWGNANLYAAATATTYGVAGAPTGTAHVDASSTNVVSVGTNAEVQATNGVDTNNATALTGGTVSLAAGDSPTGTSSSFTLVSEVDLYNNTAIPIPVPPDAQSNITSNALVLIAADSPATGTPPNPGINAAGDITISADKGNLATTAHGTGTNIYLEGLSKVASAVSNLFGGGNVTFTITGGSTSQNGSSAILADGLVDTGIQRVQNLTINYASSQANVADPTCTASSGTCLAAPTPGQIGYTTAPTTPGGDILARYANLLKLLVQYQNDPISEGAYRNEIAFMQTEMVGLGLGHFDSSGTFYTNPGVTLPSAAAQQQLVTDQTSLAAAISNLSSATSSMSGPDLAYATAIQNDIFNPQNTVNAEGLNLGLIALSDAALTKIQTLSQYTSYVGSQNAPGSGYVYLSDLAKQQSAIQGDANVILNDANSNQTTQSDIATQIANIGSIANSATYSTSGASALTSAATRINADLTAINTTLGKENSSAASLYSAAGTLAADLSSLATGSENAGQKCVAGQACDPTIYNALFAYTTPTGISGALGEIENGSNPDLHSQSQGIATAYSSEQTRFNALSGPGTSGSLSGYVNTIQGDATTVASDQTQINGSGSVPTVEQINVDPTIAPIGNIHLNASVVTTDTASVPAPLQPLVAAAMAPTSGMTLTGHQGALEAPGDAVITITNNTSDPLSLSNLTIPAYGVGLVTVNGAAINSPADITALNAGQAFSGFSSSAIMTAASTQKPTITITSNYNPTAQSNPTIAPDITLQNQATISNEGGPVTIFSVAGNIYEDGTINAASVAITAENGDVASSYQNGIDNVGGDPSRNGTTSCPAHSGISGNCANQSGLTGGIVANGDVSIAARYLNINSPIQSGIVDHTLVINADGTVNKTLSNINVTCDPTSAACGASTDRYLVDASQVHGGYIQLYGQILDTSPTIGQLTVLNGFGTINVVNYSNRPVVLSTLNTGPDPAGNGTGTAGKIDITDVHLDRVGATSVDATDANPATDPDAAMDTSANPNAVDVTHTVYTYSGGQISETQQVGSLNSQGIPVYINPTPAPTPIAGSTTSYDPMAGQRFVWTTATNNTVTTTFSTTSSDFFGSSSLSIANWTTLQNVNSVSGATTPLPNGTYISTQDTPIAGNNRETVAPNGVVIVPPQPGVATTQSNSSLENTGYTSVSNYYLTSNPSPTPTGTSSSCIWYTACTVSNDTTYYSLTQQYTQVNTNSLKADYPIGISFVGGATGAINVVSGGSVILTGAISNRSGATTITAGAPAQYATIPTGIPTETLAIDPAASVIQGASGAQITSKDIVLGASGSVGGVTDTANPTAPVNAAVAVALTGGSLTATAGDAGGSGNVAISANGNLVIGTVTAAHASATQQSTISLSSNQNIVGENSSALVQADYVSLNAPNGQITGTGGLDGNALAVNSGYTLNQALRPFGDPSQENPAIVTPYYGVQVLAGGNIDLSAGRWSDNAPGSMLVDTIDSTRGNVTLWAPGQILDNNPVQTINQRTYSQLVAFWNSLALTAGATNTAKTNQTVTAYENAMTQNYDQYWAIRDGQPNGGATYDPNYQVTYSTQQRNALAAQGWSATKISQFETAATQQYHTLNSEVGGLTGSYVAGYSYQASQAERDSLTQGGTWTANQLSFAFSAALLKTVTDTNVVVKAPNVAGNEITINAGSGIGETTQAGNGVNNQYGMVIDAGTVPSQFTDPEKVALASAEASDLQLTIAYSGGTQTISLATNPDNLTAAQQAALNAAAAGNAYTTGSYLTILTKRPLNVSATGNLNVGVQASPGSGTTDTGNAYLASQGNITLGAISVPGEARVKALGDIVNATTGSDLQAGSIILEAASGTIGGSLGASGAVSGNLVLDLLPHAPITARAENGVYLATPGSDAVVATLYSPGTVSLTAGGSIVNGTGGSLLNILANDVNLVAGTGSIGSATDFLNVGVTALTGGITAAAATSGQSVWLYGPTGNDFVIAGADSGATVDLVAANDATINGPVSAPSQISVATGGHEVIGSTGDVTTTAGSVVLQAASLKMLNGAQINATVGDVAITTTGDANTQDVGNALITGITSGSTDGNAVSVNAAGHILAGTAAGRTDITAMAPGAGVSLTAGLGIGDETEADDAAVDAPGQAPGTANAITAAANPLIIKTGHIALSSAAGNIAVATLAPILSGTISATAGSIDLAAQQGVTLSNIAAPEGGIAVQSPGAIAIQTALAGTTVGLDAGGTLTVGNVTSGGTQTLQATGNLVANTLTTTGIAGDPGNISLQSTGGDIQVQDAIANGAVNANASGAISFQSLSTKAPSTFSSQTAIDIPNASVASGTGFETPTLDLGNLSPTPGSGGPFVLSFTGPQGSMGQSANVNIVTTLPVDIQSLREGNGQITANTLAFTIANGDIGHNLRLNLPDQVLNLSSAWPAPFGANIESVFTFGRPFYLDQQGTLTTSNAFFVNNTPSSRLVYLAGDGSVPNQNFFGDLVRSTRNGEEDVTSPTSGGDVSTLSLLADWLVASRKSYGLFWSTRNAVNVRLPDTVLSEGRRSGPLRGDAGRRNADLCRLRACGYRVFQLDWTEGSALLFSPATPEAGVPRNAPMAKQSSDSMLDL